MLLKPFIFLLINLIGAFMTKIEKKDFGFQLTFASNISPEEMAQWVDDSSKALSGQSGSFGVLIDMRDLAPLSAAAKEKMEEGQKLYKAKGMARSAVVVSQGILATQFKLIAQKTGIYDWERYIDASVVTNWENIAIDWLKNGKDPD